MYEFATISWRSAIIYHSDTSTRDTDDISHDVASDTSTRDTDDISHDVASDTSTRDTETVFPTM